MLYSCKDLFNRIKAQVGAEIDSFPLEDPPTVCIITTGEDEPSARYVRNKLKDFAELGIVGEVKRFDDFYELGFMLEKESKGGYYYDGIIVQRPICVNRMTPKYAAKYVAELLNPGQDIDGVKHNSYFVPPSVRGLDLLLKEWDYDPAGKTAVVIGRGDVGRPVAEYLLGRDATVTVCHSKTYFTARQNAMKCADILIGAAGLKEAIFPTVRNRYSVIIDYGITKGPDGKLHGDFMERKSSTMQQTPVPGGMGLMVRAGLLLNIVDAYKRRRGLM